MVTPMFSAGTNLPHRFVLSPGLIRGAGLLFVLISLLGLPQSAVARESSGGVFLPSNRLDTRGIQRAKERIAKGEFSQAIRFLEEILARSEDSFVVARDGEFYGLKETARQVIKNLPPEGRRIYETTYGPVARRLLEKSIASADYQQLRQITQRYFYTPAGLEAALLFAQYEADQGRHLTAALTYQQLLETAEAAARFQPQLSVLAATNWLAAENPSRAIDVLQQIAEQGYRNIQMSGKDFPVRASQSDSMDWFMQSVGTPVRKDFVAERQWLTVRGNPARNGQVEGGLPHLRVRWQVRLLNHHRLEAVHEEMAGLLARQGKSRLPAATPLAVGDYVITRSAHGLIAIDFRTGKRIWQAQPQQVSLLADLMDGNDRENENGSANGSDLEPAQIFARMMWEDYLYNSTSSDGKRVFVIRDLSLPRLDSTRPHPFMPRGLNSTQNSNTNRLCAYDLPTQGKLVWEIDGAARRDELQGAFFLGAPVTVGQSLYCLAEIKSETALYLVVLDRQTGMLQWRQQLADLEKGVSRDIKRRLQASMPSYDKGILVCPTGAGVVVGVDLAKQALAWAYRYSPEKQLTAHQRIMASHLVAKKHWVHSVPVIAEGRVFLSPPESNHLHCVDLLTGKLLWKQPRDGALFLAGVEKEHVLLVGNRKLMARRLTDGKPIWRPESMELPAGCTPTGSGFFSKGQYFLPLSNAQVIAVDVATGKMVAAANSRDGQVLGNLVCYRGAVISQTGRYLDCFEQIEVLRKESERRRAADPTDFVALRTLGEIAYNDGRLAPAIELLSQAHESEPEDLRTREVLSEALVAGLDEDFSEYRELLPLLAQIQQGSAEEHFTLMRLQSQGLLEIGQAAEAFEVCLKAYKELATQEVELSIGRDHEVRAPRWLAAQVSSAWTAASLDQREQIAERFLPLLVQTRQVAETSHWQKFYDCFNALKQTAPLGLELATDYLEQGETLAAQQILLPLTESGDLTVRHAAIALHSRLLHEAEKPYLASTYDQALRGELANEECLPDKNGLECLAEWATSSDAMKLSWPYGRVEVAVEESITSRSTSRNRSPLTGIYLERCDDILSNCNVSLLGLVSGRNRAITIRDSLGREFYRAKLDQGTQAMMSAYRGVHGVARGNLLILSLDRQIVAFDTLSPNGQALWRRYTASSLHGLNRNGLNQSKAALIGPLSHSSCVFQIEQRLVCVDSQTGETQWSRDHLPLGCELYGDADYVLVVPKETKRALVFSTVDGRSLGEAAHKLPTAKERLATVGRQIIRWRRLANSADSRWELSSFDSFRGEVLWQHEFEKKSLIDVVQNRFAAVVEPSGHCTIVDLNEGKLVVDQPIEVNVSSSGVHLLAGTESFVLAVQQTYRADSKRRVSGLNGNGADFTKAFAGQVYVFDRGTGLASWDRPAEVLGLPLMLAQAVDLPMIAFAGNIRRHGKQGANQEMGILLLEKSSGRLLFHEETLPQSPHHWFFQVSDGDSNEAVVEMRTRKIQLKFTDRPRAPEPPAMHEVQQNLGTGSRGLQKIGAKFFRGG